MVADCPAPVGHRAGPIQRSIQVATVKTAQVDGPLATRSSCVKLYCRLVIRKECR